MGRVRGHAAAPAGTAERPRGSRGAVARQRARDSSRRVLAGGEVQQGGAAVAVEASEKFRAGFGQGTLSGPRGGINQHDRVGINKASGWPGRLHSNQVSTDPYPGLASRDNVGLSIQPYVKGVTSYSPNRRLQNYQYRNAAQVSYLKCLYGADEFRCEDANVFTVGPHAFKVGDVVLFSGVLGADRAKINGVPFVVAEVPPTGSASRRAPRRNIPRATRLTRRRGRPSTTSRPRT